MTQDAETELEKLIVKSYSGAHFDTRFFISNYKLLIILWTKYLLCRIAPVVGRIRPNQDRAG
jgi:hypothetical protein